MEVDGAGNGRIWNPPLRIATARGSGQAAPAEPRRVRADMESAPTDYHGTRVGAGGTGGTAMECGQITTARGSGRAAPAQPRRVRADYHGTRDRAVQRGVRRPVVYL